MENLNNDSGEAMSTEDLRNNNVVSCGQLPTRPINSHTGNFTLREGYFEDSLPDLTMLHQEYIDPSSGYEFVSNVNGWHSNLDNSEALMRQLSALGVRVEPEYLTLDIDATLSGTASVSTASDGNNSWDDDDDDDGSLPSPSRILFEPFENELVEAEILASGAVIVSYDNIQKNYDPPLSLNRKFQDYLCLVQSGQDEDREVNVEQTPDRPTSLQDTLRKTSHKRKVLLLKIKLLEKINELKLQPLSSLQIKCATQIRRLKDAAEELNYDSTTPDSGVHDTFVALTPDEQDKLRSDWKTELAKTEDEIQTLRQVLNSKVKHAHDLKRRLGITVWREFSDDLSSSIRSMKESPTVQKANEVFTEFSDAVAAAPLYQKTAGAVSAVGEKTGAIFGGIGAKFGQLKETPTFKSFEERVGSVYTTAKSKVTGSESNSTQDFEEALREAEAEKAATTTTSDVVDANDTVST